MPLSTPIVQIIRRDPISIEVTQSILDAIRILSQGAFHHLPVVDHKRLVGMLSTVDLLKLNGDVLSNGDAAKPALLASRTCVGDIMVKDVIPLNERATVADAAKLLSGGGFHSLPVMSGNGHLIGIVTTTDLITHMLETPATALPETVRIRMQMLESVYEAAQSYFDSGMSGLAQEHLERAVQEARWAA